MTREYLRSLLSYDPETGVFRWISRGHKLAPGSVAGALQTNGYRYVKVDGRLHKMHRLAFLFQGMPLPEEVDHINGQRDDNRWLNLRGVSRATNLKNKAKYKNGKSPMTRVAWSAEHGKWQAYINHDKRRIHLGRFASLDDAMAARSAANERYGYHANHGRA